jgi:phosphoglycerate dehydrogenase-like enzyme
MKVVLASGDKRFADEMRSEFPEVTFQLVDGDAGQVEQLRDADVLYGWPTREAFLSAERLRWIQRTGTGINQIMDLPELVESDVVLTNSRGPHAVPMADHVFAMVLSLTHRLPVLMDAQRAHDWHGGKAAGPFVDLDGRVMGILALGDVGKAVARRAFGFGMEVYAVDKHPSAAPPGVSGLWGLERLDDLLEMSDWFVVTAPLTHETRGMIDGRRLGLLKKGAYVIVISRGNIVEEEALIDHLRSGHLAGAGLDVMAKEPLPEGSPLWDMDNVVLSPHTSASSDEARAGARENFKENLRRFLANEPFLYVCDKRAGF